MNLDWNFYFDSWLIDKVPDGLEIRVEEHPSGVSINPPELTCFFGANPIYLYGLGKLYHEVLMSPDGITVYPSFLGRPGFEFVEEIKFKVDFEENTDFFGRDVVDLHTGYVSATRFMKSVLREMYGVADDSFVFISTPSSALRRLTKQDNDIISKSFDNYQVFHDVQEMRDEQCSLYMHGYGENDRNGPYELVAGQYLEAVAPGALINTNGTFGDTLFLKYTYVKIPHQMITPIGTSEFHILFTTLPQFRFGTLLDFGSTSNVNPPNYGFRMDITPSNILVYLNDGNTNMFDFPHEIDFRFTHRFSILRSGDTISISCDNEIIGVHDISNIGNVLLSGSNENVLSGKSMPSAKNDQAGDIEEFAIFGQKVSDEKMYKYNNDIVPLVKPGGLEAIAEQNVPVALSYGLTYDKPTNIFIPNFFGGKFKNFYLINEAGVVNVIGGDGSQNYYLDDHEPVENKSILIDNGFTIDSVTTFNYEDNIDFQIGTKIPVLTKLTSDVHIPLRIYMKFKLPEFYDNKTVYTMSLVLKSLKKFIWYGYEKYKTGEFV